MPTQSVSDILRAPALGATVQLKGWVRTFRSNRFLALNDGSCQASIQCVVDFEAFPEALFAA